MARKKTKKTWLPDLTLSLLPPGPVQSEHYYYVTQRPWPSLVFILPMLLVFELGTYLRQGGPVNGSSQLVATYIIDMWVNLFGRSAFYLPGLLAVAILLATHIVARQSWKFDISVLAGMLGESLIWTVPLFVFDRVLHTAILAGTTAIYDNRVDQIIRSFGAGIYEELVFRLICITGLLILMVNVFRFPRNASAICSVLISAALFAAQHHLPLGAEEFNAISFMFRTVAGLYLAGLFIFRAFGIACGCHAFYNVLVVTIRAMQT